MHNEPLEEHTSDLLPHLHATATSQSFGVCVWSNAPRCLGAKHRSAIRICWLDALEYEVRRPRVWSCHGRARGRCSLGPARALGQELGEFGFKGFGALGLHGSSSTNNEASTRTMGS